MGFGEAVGYDWKMGLEGNTLFRLNSLRYGKPIPYTLIISLRVSLICRPQVKVKDSLPDDDCHTS